MNSTDKSILQQEDTTVQQITQQDYGADRTQSTIIQTPSNYLLKQIISPQNMFKISQDAFFPQSPIKQAPNTKFTLKNRPSFIQNHQKTSQMKKMQRKSIDKTIEIPPIKGLQQTFTNALQTYDENKQKNQNSQVELNIEKDKRMKQDNKEDLFQNNMIEVGEEHLRSCKFCSLNKKNSGSLDAKENISAIQKDQKHDINYKSEQNSFKDIKKVQKNKSEEFVKICRCLRDCWSHKNCLITMTIYNKHKCRQCNSIGTFKTKRNKDWKILCKNFKMKYKEVLNIFLLFLFSIIVFSSFLIYFLYSYYLDEDSNDLITQIFALATLFILLMNGFVFLWSKVDKLCFTELDSDIKFSDLIVRKKDNVLDQKKAETNEGQKQKYYEDPTINQQQEKNYIQNIYKLNQLAKKINSFTSECSQEYVKNLQKRNSGHSNVDSNTQQNNSIQTKIPETIKHTNQNSFIQKQNKYRSSIQYPKSYQRILYNTEETEQSPFEKKNSPSFNQSSNQERISSIQKYPSTSNSSKSNSNELKKNNQSLKRINKQKKLSRIQRLKSTQQQFQLYLNKTQLNLNPKIQLNQNEPYLQNQTILKQKSQEQQDKESPTSSNIQLQQSKQESTSRFGYNSYTLNSSIKAKKRNDNTQLTQPSILSKKVDPKWKTSLFQNIDILSNQFNLNTTQMNHINEESHNNSSSISSNNDSKYDIKIDEKNPKPFQLSDSILSSTNKQRRNIEEFDINNTSQKQICS